MLVAGTIVVATVAVAGAITWQAFDGADDTTPELATAAAAEGLSATLAASDELDGCPMGDGLVGQVATALGSDALAALVDDGGVTVEASVVAPAGAIVDCRTSRGDERLVVSVSPSPAAVLVELRGDQDAAQWASLGRTNGGEYLGHCGVDEGCAVVWSDDRLLAMIHVAGPAAAQLDVERVQAVLAAALPTFVGALAP